MSKDEIISSIVEGGVIPVIRASSHEEALTVVDAVSAGGITTIEVTMTVPNAVDLIARLADERDDLLIGAGSVLDAEVARECINAGAQFIVSPATDIDTIIVCEEMQIAVMPGALTPTEILIAWNAGADFVKVFPADSMGGAKFLKSIKAPMPDIKLIPTGGVNMSTAADFIRAGAEAIGVGSDLVSLSSADEMTAAARKYLEIVAEARREY